MEKKTSIDLYLVAILLISAVFVAYWVGYGLFLYRSFQSSYFDLGIEQTSVYMHLHYINATYGLQYLSFGNHISIFRTLLMPLFFLFDSQPISLFAIQDAFVAAAAIITYLIGKDVLKSRKIGFALAVALLLNPGIRGIVMFDFHAEAFMPFLYILAFYFYMKDEPVWFMVSYTLFLSVIEVAWVVGASMIMGLLYFEFVHNRRNGNALDKAKRDKRLRSLYVCIALTGLFFAANFYIVRTLNAMYASGYYPNLPPDMRVINIYSEAQSNNVSYSLVEAAGVIFISVVVLFLAFGMTAAVDPLLSLILVSQWFAILFVLNFFRILNLDWHYYAYGVEGGLAATILGFLILSRRKDRGRLFQGSQLVIFTVVLSVTISAVCWPLFSSGRLSSFIPTNWASPNYTIAERTLRTIPADASVSAQPNLMPHLYYVLNLEATPIYGNIYWTRPDYIAISQAFPYFGDVKNNVTQRVYAYMEDNYTLYASGGGIYVYKLKGIK